MTKRGAVYVYMYACMHVCMYVCVCVYVCMNVCKNGARAHTHMHVCMEIFVPKPVSCVSMTDAELTNQPLVYHHVCMMMK